MNDEIVYLEADEEITTAIDKMLKSKGQGVKIVVPKRSTLLQSIVNLKLLKKAAESGGKKLVLVTGDRTATHLAGRVGLAVAENLKSTPATPVIAPQSEMASEVVEAEEEAPAKSARPSMDPIRTATPKPSYAKPMMVHKAVEAGEVGEAAAAAVKLPKQKGVPDFSKLQKRLLLAGLAVLLIVGGFVANYFLKHATVTLFAKGTIIKADFSFTVDPSLAKTDTKAVVLAGENLQSSHSLTATASGTGKKDVGTKSSGTITATNNCYNPGTIPSGTAFTAGGLNFVSTQAVAVPAATPAAGACPSPTTASIPVQASGNGDQYNLAARSYSSSAYSSSPPYTIAFNGSQMSGGTSKTVAVITQADVDKARDEALAKDKDTAKKDLENKAKDSQKPLAESFTGTTGSVTSSPAVDAEASSATVTIAVSYSELAVDKTEYTDLVKDQEQVQVSDQNQIYDTGIDTATLTAKPKEAGGRQGFQFTADAYGGAKIDPAGVAKQLAGKKYGDAADLATKLAGVDKAEITLNPGWATKLPSIADHIKVEIKVAPKS